MDERLQLLADQGADITIKLRAKHATVIIRTKENTYKASGATLVKAIDRACEACHNNTVSLSKIRADRKQKEIEKYGDRLDLDEGW